MIFSGLYVSNEMITMDFLFQAFCVCVCFLSRVITTWWAGVATVVKWHLIKSLNDKSKIIKIVIRTLNNQKRRNLQKRNIFLVALVASLLVPCLSICCNLLP